MPSEYRSHRYPPQPISLAGVEYFEIGFVRECDYQPEYSLFDGNESVQSMIAPKNPATSMISSLRLLSATCTSRRKSLFLIRPKLSKEDKALYSRERAEEIYKDYIENFVDDREVVAEFPCILLISSFIN